jgi:2'-5' RNA ligase
MDHAGGKELVQNVVRERDPDAGTVAIEAISLTESVLTEDGPEYSSLEAFSL